MTAVCQIHVEQLHDVLSVPVQAIVESGKNVSCYVDNGRGVERRNVEVGRNNDMFVHVRSGVAPGERVVLNPMSIVNEVQATENMISPGSPRDVPRNRGTGGRDHAQERGPASNRP
jgi:multidrug efflux pump subunit AcrA (membrane-fusion protein)